MHWKTYGPQKYNVLKNYIENVNVRMLSTVFKTTKSPPAHQIVSGRHIPISPVGGPVVTPLRIPF